MSELKVALIHDSLQTYGDPERVLEGLHQIYPDAPVYTTLVDTHGLSQVAPQLLDWELKPILRPSWRALGGLHASRWQLPQIWEAVDLSAYDLVISSTWGYLSHAVITGTHALHVCYCHTPGHYLWDTYRRPERRFWNAWFNRFLRRYDFYAAQRVDRFVTNSERVAHRIQKIYRRSAEVISPPVPIAGSGQAGERYYLYCGPLEASEHVDLAIAACQRLERPLKIVGSGSQAQRLQAQAGPLVEFITDPHPRSNLVQSDTKPQTEPQLEQIYANTTALLYPKLDADFGFAAVEAMGRGIPVIAYKHCGLADIVLHYRTGMLFEDPSVEGLVKTIQAFEKLRFLSQACIDRAQEFSDTLFASRMEWYITQALEGLN